MILNNVKIIGSAISPSRIEILGSKIKSVNSINSNYSVSENETIFNFNEAIAFPGLINSHDHLEFSLFPRVGNKIYDDYVEWGNDIHAKNKNIIENILKVPYELRYKWGLYKNLISGVTTVAHHGNGPSYNFANMPDVLHKYNYLHSVRLEKHWRFKLNILFNGKTFVIHSGEGKNAESLDEIEELIEDNYFNKKIILVHGISLTAEQSNGFTALVWCPDSNLFLYNRTAEIQKLKNNIPILIGTDSPLSADWNIWSHLRLARGMSLLSDRELFSSLTETAANTWNLKTSGSIYANYTADIVVSKKKTENEWENFYSTNPEDILLILKQGEIILIDKMIAEEQSTFNQNNYDLISIGSSAKYITKGVNELIQSIKRYLPEYEFPVEIMQDSSR